MRTRAVAVFVVVLVAAGCGGVTEPRWARDDGVSASPANFESPRSTIELGDATDIGPVALIGVIESRDPAVVATDADGMVSNVRIEPGTFVQQGETVLDFLPALSPAQLIERQILELEVELATTREQPDELILAETALSDFDAQHAGLLVTIDSPSAGIFGGARQNISYPVAAGDELFVISNDDDFVARVATGADLGLAIGSPVSVTSQADDQHSPGRVSSIEPAPDVDQILVSVSLDVEQGFALGDVVTVEVSVQGSTSDSTWIRRDALHRSDGTSFFLIERSDGSLIRFEPVIGLRTESHVEVSLDASTASIFVPGIRLVLP